MWSIHPTGTPSAPRLHRITWPWCRNPLLRSSDRLQAVLRILAALVILAAVPVSCSFGTALYTQAVTQIKAGNAAQTAVTGTLEADPADAVSSTAARGSGVVVDEDWHAPVVWIRDGKKDSATVMVPATARRGGQVQVWLGPDGRPSAGPLPTSAAAFRGIGSAVALLAVVVTAVVFATWGVDRLLDWRRSVRWEAEWRLVDRNGTVMP
ncbi:hypothetical protein K7711_31675 [Nocardia sp. CA2R105]|uniref:Rv1733c family protein n=1 Tax=Nocardia coffeae TaxID=2873381 RepID=UPI001CA76346|nr:hypothetical protein [Nocardia coffeae]MBY8861073.1 hypothetical protein [Nocardia coffeae]